MPNPSSPSEYHRLLTAWLAVLLLVAALPGVVAARPTQTPAEDDEGVSIHNERLYEKSAKAAQAALAYYGEYDNPEEKLRIYEIGYRLAAEADWHRFPFSFYLVDMPVPNAFALPGGHIFVTKGMLDLGLDDSMLACLLGHEIAHVIFEHGTKMRRRATLLNVLSQAALLGVLIGMDNEPENTRDPYGLERSGSRKGSLVQGTAATGMVFTELLMRKFSRGYEDEADEEGQRIAAGAGFDPDGARALWQLMSERLPAAESYGYWRTHPFSDLRLRAAGVRARDLKIQDPRPTDTYRRQVQESILEYSDGLPERIAEHVPFNVEELPDPTDPRSRRRDEPTVEPLRQEPPDPWEEGLRPFLERTALEAWPVGERAEKIRLAELARLKERELERPELSRDYGRLIRTYRGHLRVIETFTPDSKVLDGMRSEVARLEDEAAKLFPKAVETWQDGVFQTPFLETFLSNYPDAEQVPDVALALGNAYSRSRRQSDAVGQYLKVLKIDAERSATVTADADPADDDPADDDPENKSGDAPTASPAAQKALRGLRSLAPMLDDLVALQKLADESNDDEVRSLSAERLKIVAESFDELKVGGDYLKQFPHAAAAAGVRARLEKLAQNLYGEVVLYQGLGDHVKALERIQKILEHAPLTPAAEALREKAVLDDEE